MTELVDREELEAVLRRSRTIAVLGAHPSTWKPAFYVPDYLAGQGYRILPVNPGYAGEQMWGEKVVERLTDLSTPVDIVDVFRRGDALPEHVDEILAMSPLPSVVWFQLGIRNDAVATRLSDSGIDVVQDRCTLADHQRWGIPPVRDLKTR